MADSSTSGTPTVRSAHLEAMEQVSSNSKTFVNAHVILVVNHPLRIVFAFPTKEWNRLQIDFVCDAAGTQMIRKTVIHTKIELGAPWRSRAPTNLGRSDVPS